MSENGYWVILSLSLSYMCVLYLVKYITSFRVSDRIEDGIQEWKTSIIQSHALCMIGTSVGAVSCMREIEGGFTAILNKTDVIMLIILTLVLSVLCFVIPKWVGYLNAKHYGTLD